MSPLTAPTKLQATVHIMEVRELATTTAAGLCDPFVRVSVAGRYQRQTAIKHGMTSAVYDDKFSFPDVVLTPDEYDRAMVRVEVYTANTFTRNELVGQFAFSMSKVRSQATHEFYQQWVVLAHPNSPGAGQGFLRVSVTVLGPGDVPPSHSLAEIVEDYSAFEALQRATRLGAEGRSVVGAPQTEMRRGYDFTVKVLRAEHLEVESDTFVAVKFNGVVAVTPTKKSSKAPDWNWRLNLPIHTPLYSDVVEVELWQKGPPARPDVLVATVFLKFSDILADMYPPTWFNFYGVPPEETGLSQWWTDLVRKGKLQSTGYLGRILLSAQASLTSAPVTDDRPCAPVNGGPTTRYVMWIDVLRGSELPVSFGGGQLMVETRFGPRENARRSDWASPEVVNGETVYSFTCSGPNAPLKGDYASAPAEHEEEDAVGSEGPRQASRMCRFRPVDVILPDLHPPEDGPRKTNQMYDLVVSVYTKNLFGQESRVGFVRIKPVDVWGFKNDPEYHALKGYVEDATGFSQSQGFLLMGVQFGKWSERPEKPRENLGRLLDNRVQYEVRAYVYQARDLPPSDDGGLASTYVTVSLAGRSGRLAYTQPARYKEFEKGELHRTTTARNSLNPVWYETLLLERVELPGKLSLAPDIEVKVFAQGKDEFLGRARFPVELATTRYWPRKARARWLKLVKHDATNLRFDQLKAKSTSVLAKPMDDTSRPPPGDYNAGDILVKLEVMPVDKARRKPWYARHEWPEVERAHVLVSTVGLRGLVSLQGVKDDVTAPCVELAVPSLPDVRSMLAKAREKASLPGRAQGEPVVEEDEEDAPDSDSDLSLNGRGRDEDDVVETWAPRSSRPPADKEPAPATTLQQRQENVLKHILETMKDPDASINLGKNDDGVVKWNSRRSLSAGTKRGSAKPDEEEGGEAPRESERLFEALPQERGLTFLRYVVIPVNFPKDPFYAPAMTVRVLSAVPGKDGGGGAGWFGTGGAQVLGSAVVPLRQFARQLYGEVALQAKLVDQTFQLPALALTRDGKDRFEAIARRDSLNTASTQSLTGGGDAESDDPMSTAAALATAIAQGVDPSSIPTKPEDASDVSSDTDPFDELSDDSLHGDGEDLAANVVLEPEELNLCFEPELTPAALQLAPAVESEIRSDVTKPVQGLDEFSSVHWPGELTASESLKGCVPDTLESSEYMTPAPFSRVELFRGSRVEGRNARAGVFKAGMVVMHDVGLGAGEAAVEHDAAAMALSAVPEQLRGLFLSASPPAVVATDAVVPALAALAREGPLPIKARVYVVQGTDLYSRNPEAARPYLVLKMSVPRRVAGEFEGVAEVNDAVNFKQGVSPMFGSWYELDARLPDVTELEVQVWDHRTFGDELIGSTFVDLEDRWFNPRWQAMKSQRRFMREFRPVFAPGEAVPHGKLEMWIELYSPHEAIEAKITDIRAPKVSQWELRLALWETRGVPPIEDQNQISMYITGEMAYKTSDGLWAPEQMQSTDTHYYVKTGMGLFNWRMKFNFDVPCRYPRLTLKVWSTEWLSLQPNQVVGVAIIDLDFLVAIAAAHAGGEEPVERPRTLVKLTQDGGASRGEVDLQISMVPIKRALENPVGMGREPPNKDPFLPEPKREEFSWGTFFSGFSFYRLFCCLVVLAVPATIVAILLTR